MAVQIEKVSGLKNLILTYRLYLVSFPIYERKPFILMLIKQKKKLAEILYIADPEFEGLAITANYLDYVLLDYFAVSEKHRNSGIGSEAIKALLKRYRNKKFFLEAESTLTDADKSGIKVRRKNFYLKNGLYETGMQVRLFGTDMEIFSNGCELSFDEYVRVYTETYGNQAKKHIRLL